MVVTNWLSVQAGSVVVVVVEAETDGVVGVTVVGEISGAEVVEVTDAVVQEPWYREPHW